MIVLLPIISFLIWYGLMGVFTLVAICAVGWMLGAADDIRYEWDNNRNNVILIGVLWPFSFLLVLFYIFRSVMRALRGREN